MFYLESYFPLWQKKEFAPAKGAHVLVKIFVNIRRALKSESKKPEFYKNKQK
jgi:hypothetical protein